jgi:hypothetical protein
MYRRTEVIFGVSQRALPHRSNPKVSVDQRSPDMVGTCAECRERLLTGLGELGPVADPV